MEREFPLVGRTGFEPVTSSVSGKVGPQVSPPEGITTCGVMGQGGTWRPIAIPVLDAPVTHGALPLIDLATLSPAQIAGKRCAVPNCHRPLLLGDSFTAGRLPDGRVVRVCVECAGAVRVEVQDRSEKKVA